MSEDFKIIKAYPFNGRDSFETSPDYFKVKSNLEIPEHRIILIAPYYKPKAFTLNFYKVYEEYNSNGVNNMIINGANYDALLDTAKEPAIIANIDIDFYVQFCKEKERLRQIEKELKQATKDISFYMQMKTLAEMDPEKYGPLVDEWKKLSFKDNKNLLESTANGEENKE